MKHSKCKETTVKRTSSSTPVSIRHVQPSVQKKARAQESTKIIATQFSETIYDPSKVINDADYEEEKLMMIRRRRPMVKWNVTWLQAFLYPLALAVYLIAGALIFKAIESGHEKEVKEFGRINRRLLFDDIINKTNLSREQVEKIFQTFTEMCQNNILQNSAENSWDFLPSVMFVTAVVATIGKIKYVASRNVSTSHMVYYQQGTQAPNTQSGRIFFCFYALIGIPLFLVYMATLGKCLLGIWNSMVLRFPSKKVSTSKRIENYSVVILVLLAFVMVVFIPATIFQRLERQWSYSEAVYFAVVSLTTVGFGDYAPAARHLQGLNYVALYVTWYVELTEAMITSAATTIT